MLRGETRAAGQWRDGGPCRAAQEGYDQARHAEADANQVAARQYWDTKSSDDRVYQPGTAIFQMFRNASETVTYIPLTITIGR